MICSIEGCDRPVRARGWCGAHYVKWQRHGDPLWQAARSEEARFWAQVRVSSGCWLWIGPLRNGYADFHRGHSPHYQTVFGHRYVYELMRGPIPAGRQLHHVCRNRSCVNPAHLEVLTPDEHRRTRRLVKSTEQKRAEAQKKFHEKKRVQALAKLHRT